MSGLSADELRELRRLHLQLGRRVDSLFAGDYRSAVRGRGMEFEEVRSYYPGDDVRHIDWNVTARSGEPFVKVFREERQNTVLLAVDVSGSTRVGTGGRDGRTDRRLQIARIAGGLAYAGIRNRDRVGLVTFSDRVERYLSPRPTRGHAWAVIQTIFEAQGRHRGTDLAAALGFVARTQKRRAVIVVVSDFLDDGAWGRVLGPLARRHEVHAILVTDPLDEGLARLGLVELVDAETGEDYLVDASGWGKPGAAGEQVKGLQRAGARAVAISTEDDAYAVLHRHFQRLGARGGKR
jgi:uncharacterized protein (DUF58 family)